MAQLEPVSVEQLAQICLEGQWTPYDTACHLWALRRQQLTGQAEKDPIQFVSRLIDAMLLIYQRSVWIMATYAFPPPPLGCYHMACDLPKFGCSSNDFGEGIRVQHVREAGQISWKVAGAPYPTREAAECAARKAVALMRLRAALEAQGEPM